MDIIKNVLSYPERVCRICLCDASCQISILDTIEGDDRTIYEVLSFVTNLNISVVNEYPKQICSECHNALIKADELKQRCILSENFLKEALANAEKESHISTKIEFTLTQLPELYQCAVCAKKYSNLIDLEYHALNHTLEKHEIANNIETKPITIPITHNDNIIIENNELSKTEITCVKEESVKNEYDTELDADTCNSSDNNQENFNTSCNCSLSYNTETECNEHSKDCKINDVENKEVKGTSIKLVCPKCNVNLPDLTALTSHIQKHKEKTPKRGLKVTKTYNHKCDKCMRKFTKESSLLAHLKKHEENQQLKFTCKSCKREFMHQAHLDNHILLVHTRDRGFSCDCCDKNFTTLEALHVHKEVHKVEKKHQCKICKKSFLMLSSLTDHLRTHTGEKPYLCSTCGRGFSQKTNLEQHIRRHLGLKPFHCENCDKRFVSKGELVAHTRKHSGAHPFVCDDCGNGFTTSSSLVKHRRTHTGERPFSCDMCSMRFASSGTLKNHRRTHTGEKPYQCSFCEKAFVQRQDLVSHVRCHTGEKPYVCTNCGQAFRKASALKVHLKIHGKERDLLQGIQVQV
ncbi:gastrula zinc finger protein XlCGF57.1-like [Zerene cesonia]|uniref:gastrula zinc finger protein XlCGF57.1-like n=1 Tax=Zerene cesonia TaxID=33412 RepID=UPI0018E4F62B|nr:gastrula zinc finger protein XlCGF57.1-like [Zerene cesonia]